MKLMPIKNDRRLVIGLVSAPIAAVILFYCVPTREVAGVECSPDLVAHRSFRYQRRLWIRVSDRETREYRTPLEQYITDQKWVAIQNNEEPRWYLSKEFGNGGHNGFNDGPAKHVCKALRCYAGDSQAWVDWSRKNPEDAKQLWPEFYDLLRQERFGEAADVAWQVMNHPS